MRSSTTWTKETRPGGGRKVGQRNRVKTECRRLVQRLERAGALAPASWFARLQRIALDETAKPSDSVLAVRTLLAYRFGLPSGTLDVEVEHGVAPSVVEILERIADSSEHRRALAERERRQLAAVTVEPIKEDA